MTADKGLLIFAPALTGKEDVAIGVTARDGSTSQVIFKRLFSTSQ